MRIIVLLICHCLFYCQDSLIVYTYSKANKFAQFETELIKNCIHLYEKRYRKNINVMFIEIEAFKTGFDNLIKANEQSPPRIYINKISFTKERELEYDFSPPYMFNKYSVLSLKNTKRIKNFEPYKRFAALQGGLFLSILEKEQKKVGFKINEFKTLNDAIESMEEGNTDYLLSDYIDSWAFDLAPNFDVVQNLNDQLCILYTDKIHLDFKEKFNSIVRYYTSSQQYYQQINSYFGKEGLHFFKLGARGK